jgi:hypothetical protein
MALSPTNVANVNDPNGRVHRCQYTDVCGETLKVVRDEFSILSLAVFAMCVMRLFHPVNTMVK